jgi:hypothetical protein
MHPEMGDETLHLHMMQKALDKIEEQITIKNRPSGRGRPKLTVADRAMRSATIESQLRGIALLQGIARRQLYKVSMA